MKIGWISSSDDLNELISHLSFAKHEIIYLSYNQSDVGFNYPNVNKAKTIKELIENVDIIFTYFKKSSDLYKIYTLDHGIYDTIKQYNHKVICIDLSLTSVNLIKRIISKNPQVDFIEAPIIKTVKSNGKTSYIMPVSGKKYLFDKVQNILADFEIEFYYVGSTGTSQVISSANNVLKSTTTLGVIEAINYANAHDLDLDLLYDSVSNGAGKSEVLVQFFNNIKNGYFDIINKNFLGAQEQINSLLLDNKKISSQFLLTKVIHGILKKVNHNNSTDLDIRVFDDFYNFDYNKMHENHFNSSFITHSDDIFDDVQDNNKNLNISEDSTIQIAIDKKVIEEGKKIIEAEQVDFNQPIKHKLINFNHVIKAEPINLNEIKRIDHVGPDQTIKNELEMIELIKRETISPNHNQVYYESPKSLKDHNFKQEITNYFNDKVDEEIGSLKDSNENDYFENFISQGKKNNILDIKNINESNGHEIFGIKNSQDNNPKTLIFDLDGTLLNSNHKINEESIKTIRKASEEGHEIVIATGRSFQQSIDAIESLGVCKYAILNNGAIVYDARKNLIIQNTSPLSNELLEYFLDVAFKYKTSFLVYSELDIYGFFFNLDDKKKFEIYFNDELIDLSNMNLNELKTFFTSGQISAFNLCPFSKHLSEQDWFNLFSFYKNSLKECNLTSALEGYVDIYPYNVSKYYGYLKIKELLNLRDDDVFFFGDSNNDYELMSHLKNGVAMGNANNKLKGIACFIIGNNDEDSIANFIKNKILI